jgi:predicted glutamine amidotransferase
MCGIVGVISKYDNGFFNQQEDSFFEMLYADALRGFDSTGVIGVDNKGGFFTAKEASEAAVFIPKLKSTIYRDEMYKVGKAWIGHNRKKTVGDIADETAHPFTVDKSFALVHNGTLTSYKHLKEDALTDSQALAHVIKTALEKDNYAEAVREELGRVYGAYALVFYNQARRQIHFLRNKERPLWRVETPNAYYFASEATMATWILTRNNYQYKDLKIEPFEEHKLYTFDIDKKSWTMEDVEPKKVYTSQSTKDSHSGSAGSVNHGGNRKRGAAVNSSSFRHIKKKLLGDRITFWIDNNDWFGTNHPLDLDCGDTDVSFWSNSEDVKWRHTLFGSVDISHYNLHTEDDLTSTFWSGMVDDVVLNANSDSLIIKLTGIKPVTKSAEQQPTQMEEHLTKSSVKLMNWVDLKKCLDNLGQYMPAWKKKIYEEALAEREAEIKKMQEKLGVKTLSPAEQLELRKEGLKAAMEEAQKQGYELEYRYETTPEKHSWYKKGTKELIYESPVVILH